MFWPFDIYFCVYVNSKLLISPTCFWRLGALQRPRSAAGPLRGHTACHVPPEPSAPGRSALVPKPFRLQGWDTSPGHCGLRGIESAFLVSYFSVFTLWFELECVGELQSCGIFFFLFSLMQLNFLGEVSFLNLWGCVLLGKNFICICFRLHLKLMPYDTRLSLSPLLHSEWSSLLSLLWPYLPVSLTSLLLRNTALCTCTLLSLSIHL